MSAKAAAAKFSAATSFPLAVPAQRALLCACVTALTWACTSGSLFITLPELQRALVVGVAAGLIGELWVAVASAGLVALVGAALGPASLWAAPHAFDASAFAWALLAAGVAAGVSLLASRRLVAPKWIFWAAVALMTVNLWATVIQVDATAPTDPSTGHTYAAIMQSLAGNPDAPVKDSDEHLFVWLVGTMKSGSSYYRAFAAARPATQPGANGPTSVFNIREPLLYWLVAASPSPWLVLGVLLLLASAAAVGLVLLLGDVVKLPVLLPGVAALLSFAVVQLTSIALFTEVWAGLLALTALELLAFSLRSSRWHWLLWAAAASALIAFLIRELALFALVGGVATAFLGPADERRERLVAWCGALAIGVVALGAHLMAASHHLVAASAGAASHEGFGLGQGGPLFALRGFVYGADAFVLALGPAMLLPALLALLGVGGTLLLRARETRIVAWAVIGSIVVLGLVAGNQASTTTEASVNYWGLISQFVVYGCIPAIFAVLPVAAASTGEKGRGGS